MAQLASNAFDTHLDFESFFLGKSSASGVFQDRFGSLRRRFVVDIQGYWSGKDFLLEEDFLFDDMKTDRRVWRIRRIDDEHYEGRADDVEGVAHGQRVGEAIRWSYTLALPIGGRKRLMQFEDWFYRVGDTVINKARMSKFAIRLGDATIVFTRNADGAGRARHPVTASPAAVPTGTPAGAPG